MYKMSTFDAANPLSGTFENPELIVPGSLGVLSSPLHINDLDPDCHNWLATMGDSVARKERYDNMKVPSLDDKENLRLRREVSTFEFRDMYRNRYGFAVPTGRALKAIRDLVSRHSLAGVIEMGAGNGYWSYLLGENKVSSAAFDLHPVETGENHYWMYDLSDARRTGTKVKDAPLDEKFKRSWTHVGKLDVTNEHETVIEGFGRMAALLLVWPPYDDPMAAHALTKFAGEYFIYVGEGCGGCTGDDAFFEELSKNWKLMQEIELPRWWGLHDQMEIYKRG